MMVDFKEFIQIKVYAQTKRRVVLCELYGFLCPFFLDKKRRARYKPVLMGVNNASVNFFTIAKIIGIYNEFFHVLPGIIPRLCS